MLRQISAMMRIVIVCVGVMVSVAHPQQPPLPPGIVQEQDIEFANPDNQHLKLDLYRPEKGGPFPVVICIHGGGFVGGHRETMRWMCVRLAVEGYAAATIQYRLAPKYQFPACVEDCKAAVRWIRANAKKYNFDSDRIAAMGTSAGGHLAVFLAATADVKDFEGTGGNPNFSTRISCAVNAFGPSDFTRIQGKSKSEPVLVPFLGGPLQTHRQQYIRSSPLYWITPNSAPVLTLIGTKDEHVPVEQAKWLHERLDACGVPNQLVIFEGAGHGFRGEDQEKAIDVTLTFLAKFLKQAPRKQSEKPSDQHAVGSDQTKPPVRAPRKTPFVLVIPAYRNCDKLIETWNNQLGSDRDLYVCMPGPQDLKDPTKVEAIFRKVKRGQPGIVTPSAELFLRGEAKLPSSARWLWYDPEPYWPHTPQKEKDDPLAAAKALRQWCDTRKLKLGMTPIYKPLEKNFDVDYAAQVATFCDAYILQCQDWQLDPERFRRITQHLQQLQKAIHKANPKCLVGCQLGVASRYGGVEAALKLYDATRDHIQLYTAWWEPEEDKVVELLKHLGKP